MEHEEVAFVRGCDSASEQRRFIAGCRSWQVTTFLEEIAFSCCGRQDFGIARVEIEPLNASSDPQIGNLSGVGGVNVADAKVWSLRLCLGQSRGTAASLAGSAVKAGYRWLAANGHARHLRAVVGNNDPWFSAPPGDDGVQCPCKPHP